MPFNISTDFQEANPVAEEALTYGLDHSYSKGIQSVYSHRAIEAQKYNPFDKPIVVMDSAQAVYWCFHQAGVELGGGAEKVNVLNLYYDPKLEVVRQTGQKSEDVFDTLVKGDLVFFGSKLSLVGLYAGVGEVLIIGGSGGWNADYPYNTYDMTSGFWWNQFNGAIRRWK